MILLERNLFGLGVRRYRLDAKPAFISYVALSMPLNTAEVWKVGQWGYVGVWSVGGGVWGGRFIEGKK